MNEVFKDDTLKELCFWMLCSKSVCVRDGLCNGCVMWWE